MTIASKVSQAMPGLLVDQGLQREFGGGQFALALMRPTLLEARGAAQLLEKVCEKTGVNPGEGPSPDGLWSVEEVECLARQAAKNCSSRISQGAIPLHGSPETSRMES